MCSSCLGMRADNSRILSMKSIAVTPLLLTTQWLFSSISYIPSYDNVKIKKAMSLNSYSNPSRCVFGLNTFGTLQFAIIQPKQKEASLFLDVHLLKLFWPTKIKLILAWISHLSNTVICAYRPDLRYSVTKRNARWGSFFV